MFFDRADAGKKLVQELLKRKVKDVVVIAIPRGGIIPAYVIADELKAPLEVAMVKKIGHPDNPEFAIGAVNMQGQIINGFTGISEEYITQTALKIQKLLEERYRNYHGEKRPENLKGKTVIVVDDGIATGRTLMAALQFIRMQNPGKVIAAIPVGPASSVARLKEFADEIICLESPEDFWAIGIHYKHFDQVSDDEVKELLQKQNARIEGKNPNSE